MPRLLRERKPRISVDLEVRIWYDENQGSIHIAGNDLHSHVNPDPESRRGHPNLFRKLAQILRKAGKPAPTP